ncbi:uncharacterized protein LOC100367582 [Saccoglossus kowalevskii]|uniref:Uncharacterized protein LOC100367582 n=1 Tax=Saccoglossus kowalevskii TaxID=10224 RepID=A0ABM0MIE8_SACKO|nr:PREDICTED: uncharacterized protein LOC100367582 [Saccoglossus kowalevskii]
MSLATTAAAINSRFVELYKAGDMKTLATELYHEDCKLLLSGVEPLFGRKGVEEGLNALKKSGVAEIKIASEEIDGFETDTAYDRGNCIFFNDDGIQLEVGKYLAIYKKVHGKYLMCIDIANSNI